MTDTENIDRRYELGQVVTVKGEHTIMHPEHGPMDATDGLAYRIVWLPEPGAPVSYGIKALTGHNVEFFDAPMLRPLAEGSYTDRGTVILNP